MKLHQKIVYEDIAWISSRLDLEKLKNSKILLSGANGLLGFYFANLFSYLNKEKGFRISCDLFTKSDVSPASRIYDIKDSPGFRIKKADLSKENPYEEVYDFVIYAAGYSAPFQFLKDPLEVININFLGMKNVLEHVLKTSKSTKILYFSSSEIYGSPANENVPTPETYEGNSSIESKRACYIESKRLTEVLCLTYREKFGMDIKIARPALTYGPGMNFDDKRVISEFIKKAHFEKKIIMLDDGRDLRCFSYIRDTIAELLLVLLFGKDTIYNIGSDKDEISIKGLADIIGEIMGAEVVAGEIKKGAIDAPVRVCLDISKVKSEFNFSPEMSLKEGFKRTVEWAISSAGDNEK